MMIPLNAFESLLDPEKIKEGQQLTPGLQQELARNVFPELVRTSKMQYWSTSDIDTSTGQKLVVGLAASYSLPDLKLADAINRALSHGVDCRVDVFNLDDLCARTAFANLTPSIGKIVSSPVVGLWVNDSFKCAAQGHQAVQLIATTLKIAG